MEQALFDHRAKPGDLIEIFRGSYEHWAIYVGGEEVVHLIPPQEESGASDLFKFLDSSTAQVRRQKLREVVGFHRFRINNLRDGECEPRERRAIVRDACAMVGRELPYCLATSNCEHFVTELRYGKPRSQQVEAVAVMGGVATAGVALAVLGAALFASFSSKDDDNERSRRRRNR
ncbi:phospholipase A and acyltransferase 4 [Scophthalmus maximus]|uniref:phospholipase A and acyltransferase 4 n=1 Tax=Scophthalmus maximus TaxID=52904 RepID=UPI001FA8CADF|nr:phospholipase A and acyltransferase 4 [Scophthalmus maximus]